MILIAAFIGKAEGDCDRALLEMTLRPPIYLQPHGRNNFPLVGARHTQDLEHVDL